MHGSTFILKEMGKPSHGYVLHHKDPSWRTEDPERYAEWRPDDLEMMTRGDHIALHNSLDPQRCSNPGEKNGMYEQGWKLQGEKNGRYGLHGKDNPIFGQKRTEEQKEKMSIAQQQSYLSEERHNIQVNAVTKGWETRLKTGKIGRAFFIKCLETGKVFQSARKAQIEMSLDRKDILKAAREHSVLCGYHFEISTREEFLCQN